MPFARDRYVSNWPEIRARILERDEHRCQQCKMPQYSVGVRLDDGTFLLSEEAKSYKEAKKFVEELKVIFCIDPIVVVLAVAHVENPDPMDCREENLAALCQYHHIQLDKYLHSQNAQATRERKRLMPQGLSFRFPDEVVAKLKEEAERKQVTQTDIVMQAIEDYFRRDRQRQNFEDLMHEIVKTRSMVARVFDPQGKVMTQKLLDVAGEDATEYLEQQRKRS